MKKGERLVIQRTSSGARVWIREHGSADLILKTRRGDQTTPVRMLRKRNNSSYKGNLLFTKSS